MGAASASEVPALPQSGAVVSRENSPTDDTTVTYHPLGARYGHSPMSACEAIGEPRHALVPRSNHLGHVRGDVRLTLEAHRARQLELHRLGAYRHPVECNSGFAKPRDAVPIQPLEKCGCETEARASSTHRRECVLAEGLGRRIPKPHEIARESRGVLGEWIDRRRWGEMQPRQGERAHDGGGHT